MEKYPPQLTKELQPLVAIIGNIDNEPDIHNRIIYSIRMTFDDNDGESSSIPALKFQSLLPEHEFKEKKTPREFPSFDGILKSNWLQKHCEQLPAVVLFLVTFSVDWSNAEWIKREAVYQDKYNKIKSTLSPRDGKVILMAVKVGLGTLDKDVLDDRLSLLKRHLNLDSRSFFFLTNNDVSQSSLLLFKRISKSIREYIVLYYSTQCKRVRGLERSMAVNRSALDSILSIRYNFKLGIFYEFLGQKNQSIKYYRSSYDACVHGIEFLDEEWTDQIEALAEYCNFKICSILLQTLSINEATAHFKSHILKFLKAYSTPWRHFAWLADQYIIFAQLLDLYKISDNYNNDCDRSYYYANAARYLLKRQTLFENTIEITADMISRQRELLIHTTKLINSNVNYLSSYYSSLQMTSISLPEAIPTSSPKASNQLLNFSGIPAVVSSDNNQLNNQANHDVNAIFNPLSIVANDSHSSSNSHGSSVDTSKVIRYRGMTLTASKYVGSAPQFYDPFLDQLQPYTLETDVFVKKYYEEREKSVDHGSLILLQLHLALMHIDLTHKRRKIHIQSSIAELYYKIELYDLALVYLHDITSILSMDGWISSAIPYLYQQLDCCLHLGKLQEYLNICLILFSKEANQNLDIYKKIQLHNDFLSILKSCQRPESLNYSKANFCIGDYVNSIENKGKFNDSSSSSNNLDELNYSLSSKSADKSEALYVDVVKRKEYGSHASGDAVVEFFLPNETVISISSYTYPKIIDLRTNLSNSWNSARSRTSSLNIELNSSSTSSSNTQNSDQASSTNTNNDTTKLFYPKLFDVSTKFHEFIVEVGSSLNVSVTLRSLLQLVTAFDEMIIHFFGDSIIMKIRHVSDLPYGSFNVISINDNVYICEGSLIFQAKDDVTFTFQIIVTEDIVHRILRYQSGALVPGNSSLPQHMSSSHESILCVEKIEFVVINRIDSSLIVDGNDVSVIAVHDNIQATQHEHRVVLSLQIVPIGITKSRESQLSLGSATSSTTSVAAPRPWSIREIILLFGVPRESLLQILRPTASVSLVYPYTPGANLLPTQVTSSVSSSGVSRDSNNVTTRTSFTAAAPGVGSVIGSKDGNIPPVINLIQGPLQRVNLIFYSDSNEVIDGKMYLACEYSPMSGDDYLFWYPDTSSPVLEVTSSMSVPTVDDVLDHHTFYPLHLNSSFQPSQAFLLSNAHVPAHTYFDFPLFLRSELIGLFKFKARLEYRCSSKLKQFVTKEFDTRLNFVRPLQVNFSLTSHREAQCGVVRDSSLSTVLKGDTITVSTSLTCLDSLSRSIDIKTFEIKPNLTYDEDSVKEALKPPSKSDSQSQVQANSFFRIKGSNGFDSHSLLLPTNLSQPCYSGGVVNGVDKISTFGVTLRKGENYANSTDVVCFEATPHALPPLIPSDSAIHSIYSNSSSNNTASSTNSYGNVANVSGTNKVSMGNIYVYWRLNDPDLLKPLNIKQFLDIHNVNYIDANGSINKSVVGIVNTSKASDCGLADVASTFDWLPKIERRGLITRSRTSSLEVNGINKVRSDSIAEDSPVNRETSITRLCSMIFSIPAVQVVAAPFDVAVKSKSIVSLTEVFEVSFIITNKLWSVEKLLLKADLNESFLISGPTSISFDISPQAKVKLTMAYTPLKCGQVALPHVNILWERNSTTVLDVGSNISPKYLFVKPN